MNETALLQNFLVIGGVLFALGLVGFLVRRNAIIMFLCAEMMLQGVAVTLVAFSRYHSWIDGTLNLDGQMLVLFIIAVAACEAGIALALILMLFQRSGTLDIADAFEVHRPGGLRAHAIPDHGRGELRQDIGRSIRCSVGQARCEIDRPAEHIAIAFDDRPDMQPGMPAR